MECARQQRGSEPSFGQASTAVATWALLQEASGDSESGDLTGAAAEAADGSHAFDADDGDAESCSGGEDDDGCGGVTELDVVGRRLVSWECWMVEGATSRVVMVGGEGARPAPASTEDGDAEGDKLFWEACIAHGY